MLAFEVGELLGVNQGVEVKFDSELGEHFDFPQALAQGEFVFGDAVGVQAAGEGPGVVDDGAETTAAQLGGAGQGGGSGSDQGYGEAGAGGRGEGQRGSACVERIHSQALQAGDLGGVFVVAGG